MQLKVALFEKKVGLQGELKTKNMFTAFISLNNSIEIMSTS